MNNQWFSKIAVWLVVALVLFTVFKQFDRASTGAVAIGYSDFLEEVRAKRIKAVTLQEGGGSTEIIATTTDDNAASIAVMRKVGMVVERNPLPEPPWFQVVGILVNTKPLISRISTDI